MFTPLQQLAGDLVEKDPGAAALLRAADPDDFQAITLKAVGLDPAQCSSIILTTVTDVVGFFAFLGFAVLFQMYLA